MSPFRLLITGSREVSDKEFVWATLDKVLSKRLPDVVLIHGACPRGVDRLAAEWATVHGVTQEPFPADWDAHGKLAGMKRNIDMVEVADAVLGIRKDMSRGTTHCVDQAVRKGRPTVVYDVVDDVAGKVVGWKITNHNRTQMPKVSVVNVRGLNGVIVRRTVAYVGRAWAGWQAHPLANPFAMKSAINHAPDDKERERVVSEYKKWLFARPNLDNELADLWEATENGKLPLGCWCHPLLCHAHILAEELNKRYAT